MPAPSKDDECHGDDVRRQITKEEYAAGKATCRACSQLVSIWHQRREANGTYTGVLKKHLKIMGRRKGRTSKEIPAIDKCLLVSLGSLVQDSIDCQLLLVAVQGALWDEIARAEPGTPWANLRHVDVTCGREGWIVPPGIKRDVELIVRAVHHYGDWRAKAAIVHGRPE